MVGDRGTGPGEVRSATLYDVARAAGVSTATVSRVIHGSDPVRPATRRRVLEAVEELGYVPDGSAQSLAQRRKEVIGFLAVISRGPETDVERQGSLFTQEVLRGIESSVGDLGWSVLITFLRDSNPGYANQRMLRMSAKVDGLLTGILPSFVREGKSYLTIALGCTGGRHRSVTLAEALAKADPRWLNDLITRHVPLNQWADAYTRRPDDIKTVLDFPDASP